MHLAKALRSPALASILRQRGFSGMILGLAALQVVLAFVHFPGWRCPALNTLGVPCPGCGLTRALVALLRLDFETMGMMHAFAPVVFVALVLIALAAILPVQARDWLVHRIERLEKVTGVTGLLLIALVLYWFARLISHRRLLMELLAS